jgi:hypothetical protein
MRETRISLRELDLIAATRAALGAGLGLLLGGSLPDRGRKVIGWSLVLAGVASTFPLLADVLRRSREAPGTAGWWDEMEMAPAHA